MTKSKLTKNHDGPIVMELQGIIGAGKTTVLYKCLLPILTNMGYRVCVIDEPVEEMEKNGLLKKFYEDPKKYSFRLQIRFFTQRLLKCRELYNKHKDTADIIILERSILSDVHFVNLLKQDGSMTEDEAEDYMSWWNLWSELLPFKPDIMFMVSAPMDVCMQRINERARDGETKIRRDYQEKLLKEYNSKISNGNYYISDNLAIPCHTIDSTKNYVNDNSVANLLVNDIVEKIKNM